MQYFKKYIKKNITIKEFLYKNFKEGFYDL